MHNQLVNVVLCYLTGRREWDVQARSKSMCDVFELHYILTWRSFEIKIRTSSMVPTHIWLSIDEWMSKDDPGHTQHPDPIDRAQCPCNLCGRQQLTAIGVDGKW